MIFEESESLKERITELSGRPARDRPRVFENTSEFMSIDGGDVLRLSGNLMFPHRVANLRKLFPHLPLDLNKILMRFSVESADRYPDLDTLLSDLRSLSSLGQGPQEFTIGNQGKN